jgi:hypothetical protein
MFDGLRRHPTQRPDRRSRIRNAQELEYPVPHQPPNWTLGSLNNRAIRLDDRLWRVRRVL